MSGKPVNFETVRKIGLTFPGVEESTAYRSPVLRVHGRIMAGIAVNRSAEPGSLMLCVDGDDAAELLSADPEVYYVTDHYAGHAVLVRLSRLDPDALRDLLGMAYKFVTANAARGPAARKRGRRKGES